MDLIDRQRRLGELFKQYPELERCSEIMIPLMAFSITNDNP